MPNPDIASRESGRSTVLWPFHHHEAVAAGYNKDMAEDKELALTPSTRQKVSRSVRCLPAHLLPKMDEA